MGVQWHGLCPCSIISPCRSRGEASVTGLGGDITFGHPFWLDDPTPGVPGHLVRQETHASRAFPGPERQGECCSLCWTPIHGMAVPMASFCRSTASHQVVQQPWDEFVLLHRRMKDIVPKPLSLLHRPGTALQHKRALLLPVGWKKSSFKRAAKLRMHVCEQSISAGVLLALGRGVSISKRHL